ncbi:hypothetical protein J6590_020379 [Homalodisca vitripennis]|nr:hypothetical protein J6590_020379 [Homalodisca vitripennis]
MIRSLDTHRSALGSSHAAVPQPRTIQHHLEPHPSSSSSSSSFFRVDELISHHSPSIIGKQDELSRLGQNLFRAEQSNSCLVAGIMVRNVTTNLATGAFDTRGCLYKGYSKRLERRIHDDVSNENEVINKMASRSDPCGTPDLQLQPTNHVSSRSACAPTASCRRLINNSSALISHTARACVAGLCFRYLHCLHTLLRLQTCWFRYLVTLIN